ncbi:hypothetical protein PP175_25685 (plasmid) [Aneurinibacillus sp. Ricciae_BoGa-3]|uniref:hypothetical protein n=1 Tax=Aneurinibacillus sp. Ricciae_BoGa-3 TaxID=3022697 RepID=UPI0023401273|nr:hypothetical protein [Aneurinibacillus sp. Ricciae_BoGa-3]WCK57461.1 hypothetical protein PP175_25685 [Aneurinibacillus sp. Ricciae_BoGa-3]
MIAIIRPYKIILSLMELFLGLPLIGGVFILAHAWTPLLVMFILHAVGLMFAFMTNRRKIGHIIGMVGNVLAFIPIIGMFFHLVIVLILIYEIKKEKDE